MLQQEENYSSPPVLTSNHKGDKRVLIFDSGVGGLTVYNEIRKKMPDLSYIYAFDNKGFPYGEKPDPVIIRRVNQFITQICQQYFVDIIVIACNTASTIVLPTLRSQLSIPIIGVVPAIKPGVALSKNKIIGLLATNATINRQYTHDLIKQFASDCDVSLLGSAELAIISEQKMLKQTVDIQKIKQILTPWLYPNRTPDTVILGCTHYPLLKAELLTLLTDKTQIIDSGEAIARRVFDLLITEKKENPLHSQRLSRLKNTAICTSLSSDIDNYRAILKDYNFNDLVSMTVD